MILWLGPRCVLVQGKCLRDLWHIHPSRSGPIDYDQLIADRVPCTSKVWFRMQHRLEAAGRRMLKQVNTFMHLLKTRSSFHRALPSDMDSICFMKVKLQSRGLVSICLKTATLPNCDSSGNDLCFHPIATNPMCSEYPPAPGGSKCVRNDDQVDIERGPKRKKTVLNQPTTI